MTSSCSSTKNVTSVLTSFEQLQCLQHTSVILRFLLLRHPRLAFRCLNGNRNRPQLRANHLLDSLGLPKILQGQIQTSVEASADSFLENVCGFLTKTIMNTAGYLLTFLVVFLLIRILYLVTGLISYIPILHGINTVLGGVFGLAEAGVILWVLCQAVTVALPSDTGREVMQAIARNTILSYIYNTLFAIGSIL